ncbi:MAG: alpha-glucosidase C-terminal domain-containing protein, partial [Lachnospiraceae bacterium]|nr:alpha-glucosidase C-terminal domain-containing protein [Lachnospiraceae bacterium]
HNYFEIAHTIRRLFGQGGQGGGLVREGRLYTFVENHDVNRLIDKVNRPEHIKNIYLLSYTLPGIPSVYYGGEFLLHGVQANGSDDAIRPAISPEQYRELAVKEKSFVDYLAMLGRAKGVLPALSTGSYEERLLTNRQYAYARVCEGQTVIVAANNDEAPAQLNVRAEAGEYIDFETGERCGCNGTLVLTLQPHSGKLLVRGGFEAGQAWNAVGAESESAAQDAENGDAAQNAQSAGSESGTQHILAETARREAETRAERLASGARFEGLLIKESIDDEAILDKITVNKVELWKTDGKPRYWTALHFTSDCAEFPEAAAKVMIADPARGGNWFVDFRCGNIKYIVFRNRVLSYEIGSETEKQAVKESCLALGVKEEEMQWAEA